MRIVLAILLIVSNLFAQVRIPGPGGVPSPSGSTPITLDASCTGSASASDHAACSSAMTVTAGDTITCEGYKNNNFDPGNLYFNDPINGYYASVTGNVHPTSANIWVGTAVFESSVSGSITPQVWNWESAGMGIACQAWKGTPASFTLDGGAVNLFRSATAANPTSGTAASPTNANEVIVCQLVRATAATTSNSGAWLPSGTLTGVTETIAQYFQYMIQTTATSENCPYTSASAAFTDTQVALINASSTGGYKGLTGVFGAPANAQTNGATASLTILNTSTGTTAGSLYTLSPATASAMWALQSGSATTFQTNAGVGATIAPLGSLKLLVNGQSHTLGDAATAVRIPAANCTTGYNASTEGLQDTGQGGWYGVFVYVEGSLTNSQGSDIMNIFGSMTDGTLAVQWNTTGTTSGACSSSPFNTAPCLDIEVANTSTTGAALNPTGLTHDQGFFIIIHAAGINNPNHELYVLAEATPGTLPWVVVGHSTKAVTGTPAATTLGTVTAGSTALTVTSGTGLTAGSADVANGIAMAGVPPGTYLASGSGTSWVMSQPATTNEVAVTASFWAAAGGPFGATFGKYSSCSLNNNVDFSGFIYDPYGVILPLIAAGTISL